MPRTDPARFEHDRHLTGWLRHVVDALTEIAEPAATS
jgi:hypothetical protein